MNPSYFRIKVNMKEAVERLCIWNGSDCKEWIETGLSDAVDVSLNENGTWKGTCLYVYEKDGWTIFEDLSGSYSFLEPDEWKKLAAKDELVYAGYNDAIIYAEMVKIQNSTVTKYFLEWFDAPEENTNEGDGIADIENWTDVASFVDNDELAYSDHGVVLVF